MNLVKTLAMPFLCSILFLISSYSEAQQKKVEFSPDQYRAINWTSDDGLSAGEHFVLKDSKGFTWVGALKGLLFRFDGVHFEKIMTNHKKPGTIIEAITSLIEDSLKNIWIGTYRGLFRYDLKADTFKNFVTPVDSVNADKSIVPFWCTRKDLYCLESSFRIVKYDIHYPSEKVSFFTDH